jgi:predicted nucleic acid-binding protein
VIVVDASAVVELLLRTPDAARVEAAVLSRGEALHAPHLLDLEVPQVLRRYAARGDISEARGAISLEILARMPIRRHAHTPLLDRIWALRAHVTAYDGAYVALAERLGATLVTRDARLGRASGLRARVEVI